MHSQFDVRLIEFDPDELEAGRHRSLTGASASTERVEDDTPAASAKSHQIAH